MKSLLLTGVTGFIGSEILARLVKIQSQSKNFNLSVVARKKPNTTTSLLARRFKEKGLDPTLIDTLQWIECSFEDEKLFRDTLKSLPNEYDRVLHMAAIIKATGVNSAQERLNQGVTNDLLDFANERQASFYYLSSVVAFGATQSDVVRNENDFPNWQTFNDNFPYYATKREAHKDVLKRAKVGGVLFCPSVVHGSLELEKNSRSHLKALREGKLPFAPSAGANFVALEDVVEPILEEILKPESERPSSMQTRLLVGNNLEFVDYFKLYQDTYAEFLLSKGLDISHIRKSMLRIPDWASQTLGFLNQKLRMFKLDLSALSAIEQSSSYLYFESLYRKEPAHLDQLKAALLRSFEGSLDEGSTRS